MINMCNAGIKCLRNMDHTICCRECQFIGSIECQLDNYHLNCKGFKDELPLNFSHKLCKNYNNNVSYFSLVLFFSVLILGIICVINR